MLRAIPKSIVAALAAALFAAASAAHAQQSDFKPYVGQQGKDVVWVPTPDEVVERMLTMAQTKPEDYVIDLGAGDGKIAIAAAKKFGARSMGVEYNPEMVAFAQKNAQAAGVTGKAQIVHGDIFATDFTQATVITMYLLPSLNMKLRPQILALRPGHARRHARLQHGGLGARRVHRRRRTASLFLDRSGEHRRALVAGALRARSSDKLSLNFDQKFQRIEGVAYLGSVLAGLREPRLSGFRISFAYVDGKGVRRDFRRAGDRRCHGGLVPRRWRPGGPLDGGEEIAGTNARALQRLVGAVAERLIAGALAAAQTTAFSALVTVNFTGVNSVVLCVPSQNGWLFEPRSGTTSSRRGELDRVRGFLREVGFGHDLLSSWGGSGMTAGPGV